MNELDTKRSSLINELVAPHRLGHIPLGCPQYPCQLFVVWSVCNDAFLIDTLSPNFFKAATALTDTGGSEMTKGDGDQR